MSLEAPESSSNDTTKLTRTPSNLSNSMTEDWDKSFSSTPHANGDLPLPGSAAAATSDAKDGTEGGGERNRRSLSDLMRLYGEHGKDMQLSAEEEKVLKEELGLWVSGLRLRLFSSFCYRSPV